VNGNVGQRVIFGARRSLAGFSGIHLRFWPKLKNVRSRSALDVLSKHARAIQKAHDFDDLFHLIDTALEPIPGLGELYVYDTTLRIGAKLNLFPDKVYLHAGTRLGARALGLRTAATLKMSELPKEFRALKPHEIEDVLCIFKDELKASAATSVTPDIFERSWCN
jgi:hypothetical protein